MPPASRQKRAAWQHNDGGSDKRPAHFQQKLSGNKQKLPTLRGVPLIGNMAVSKPTAAVTLTTVTIASLAVLVAAAAVGVAVSKELFPGATWGVIQTVRSLGFTHLHTSISDALDGTEQGIWKKWEDDARPFTYQPPLEIPLLRDTDTKDTVDLSRPLLVGAHAWLLPGVLGAGATAPSGIRTGGFARLCWNCDSRFSSQLCVGPRALPQNARRHASVHRSAPAPSTRRCGDRFLCQRDQGRPEAGVKGQGR